MNLYQWQITCLEKYVRESSDDEIYLGDISQSHIFSIRYNTEDDSFSNDLYEYAGMTLLSKLQGRNASGKMMAEYRSCILEGLICPDHLFDDTVFEKNRSAAETVHEKNYWLTMQQISRLLKTR